jgi:NADPH:quinone reductase-like Zn-dependent oxidoreductase
MRAIRVHAYGEPLRVDDISPPGPPDAGQLGVAVQAVGVGSWDVGVARGSLAKFVGREPPFVLGAELAGRVAAVGSDVEGFALGDRVFANPGIVGAWAERLNIKATACGPAPESLDAAHAAAIPVGAVTALQALDMLALVPGASLLVLGAGGSVGRAAIQLARIRGLIVHALVPAWEMAESRELGAHATLDQASDWVAQLRGPIDGVIDLVGGPALERAAATLGADGRAVTTLADSMREPVAADIPMDYLRMRSTTADLAAISAYVDAGELNLPVGVVLPVEDVQIALGDMQTRHDSGKHVLQF